VKKEPDRLRNRLFRWIGVTPVDDFEDTLDAFDAYVADVWKVLESFEVFTRKTATFAGVVADKLNIKNIADEIRDLEEKIRKEQQGNMFQ
jgi:hypothetical protein